MDGDWLAERFEADRAHLHAVAWRLLGSASEADDAVQETWIRLNRADTSEVENLSGWLTTVVGRVCLDLLRKRQSQREEPLEVQDASAIGGASPEREAILAESVGIAMQAVLQNLAPAERVAFVLHDVFGIGFDEIAGIVERTPAATRKLASRGRQRVRGISDNARIEDDSRHRTIVEAFFRASRDGDIAGLLAVLAPEVMLRVDATALRMGLRNGWITQEEMRGAEAVAEQFSGNASAAQMALIDGRPGGVWAARGAPIVAFRFAIRDDKVAGIELVADPERLGEAEIEILG